MAESWSVFLIKSIYFICIRWRDEGVPGEIGVGLPEVLFLLKFATKMAQPSVFSGKRGGPGSAALRPYDALILRAEGA